MKSPGDSQTVVADKNQWFDTARAINEDWVVVNLTTPQGEKVQYRIPQHEYLQTMDELQEVSD